MSGHSDKVAELGVEQALKCSSLLVLLGFDENLGNPGMNSCTQSRVGAERNLLLRQIRFGAEGGGLYTAQESSH